MNLKFGLVGATGLVGEVFLDLLQKRKFPLRELRLFASDRSIGQIRMVHNERLPVQALEPESFQGLDVVFFSAGEDISAEWAPRAVSSGAFAIDNSSAFRLVEDTPLIVPEVNPESLPPRELPSIIANPNCSTVQLVMALRPLQENFGLAQVRVATYQAVSGAGRGAREELLAQTRALVDGQPEPEPLYFPKDIAFNGLPQVGAIGDDGFCSEERKIRLESRKILMLPHLRISAWTVRVPILNVHSEAVWVTLEQPATRLEMLTALRKMPGLCVYENEAEYATAREVSETDSVHVSRIHQDPDDPRTWLMWIVADNLRKGAALNGLQIAEKLFGLPTPSN